MKLFLNLLFGDPLVEKINKQTNKKPPKQKNKQTKKPR